MQTKLYQQKVEKVTAVKTAIDLNKDQMEEYKSSQSFINN